MKVCIRMGARVCSVKVHFPPTHRYYMHTFLAQWQFIIGNLDSLNSLCDKYYWFWVIVAYSAGKWNAINCIFAVNLLPIRWLVIMINVCECSDIAYKLSTILVSIYMGRMRRARKRESICTGKPTKENNIN